MPCNSYEYVTGGMLVCLNLDFCWRWLTASELERSGALVTVNLRSDYAGMPSPVLRSRLRGLLE